MEEEFLGGLLEEGILGSLVVGLCFAVRYLYKELQRSWEERLAALQESNKAYIELNIETVTTLKVLSTLLQEVGTDVGQLKAAHKDRN